MQLLWASTLLLGLLPATNACTGQPGDPGQPYLIPDDDPSYWLDGGDGQKLADAMITYQHTAGGWPKCIYPIKIDDEYTGNEKGSLDNKASIYEIRFMALAWKETDIKEYRNSARDGFNFIIKAQTSEGGWPQYSPRKFGSSHYSNQITFNDDLHVNAMRLLEEVADETPPFDHGYWDLDLKRMTASQRIERGIKVIIDSQLEDKLRVEGSNCPLNIGWCAQHKRGNLKAIPARDFEPKSFSGKEGMALGQYLISAYNRFSDDELKQKIVKAVQGAYVWAKRNTLEGYVVKRRRENPSDCRKRGKYLAEDEEGRLWPRFSDLEDQSPIFCTRGCTKNDSKYYTNFPDDYAKFSSERRNCYTWLSNDSGKNFIEDFDDWGVADAPSPACWGADEPPSDDPPVCRADECIDECGQMYPGDPSTGFTYACIKGCAGASSGRVTDKEKFCDIDEAIRFDTCRESCSKASSNKDKQEACRNGCNFWCTVSVDSCINKCKRGYSGDLSSGGLKYCAKGCAETGNGSVSDPLRYCAREENERYSFCKESCEGTSSNQSNVEKCKDGCKHWDTSLFN